jgi:hypothetical protein
MLPLSPRASKRSREFEAAVNDPSCSGADQFAERIATSEEGVPAMFGGLVSPDLKNAFATNRTKPNMNPPTTVPYITEAGT